MDIYKRLAYLHQVQTLLNDQDYDVNRDEEQGDQEPDAKKKLGAVRLNSFYGYLQKEIAMKHNVQILNCDPMKLFRCKRCHCQYDRQTLKLVKRKTKRRFVNIVCRHCSYEKKIIFRMADKTKLEQLVRQLESTTA